MNLLDGFGNIEQIYHIVFGAENNVNRKIE